MSVAVERYLDQVLLYARRTEADAAAIRAEIKDHLETKVGELENQGLPREDAIFKAIEDHGNPMIVGYRLRPHFPWVDVRMRGTARGVVAIGPRAVGVVAMGGMAMGVVSFGGLSIGVFGMGGLCLALLLAWGGLAVAPLGLATGGLAIGALAAGGVAVGAAASGGVAVGLAATGGFAVGMVTGPAGHAVASYPQIAQAPGWLQWLAAWIPLLYGPFIWVTFGVCQLLTLALTGVTVVVQVREQRRLRQTGAQWAR